jgi:hypothetical protein
VKDELRSAYLVGPSNNRIEPATQDQAKKELDKNKAALKLTKQRGVGSNPCKVLGCPYGYYILPANANRHMRKVHNLTVDDPRMYETQKQREQKERATRKSQRKTTTKKNQTENTEKVQPKKNEEDAQEEEGEEEREMNGQEEAQDDDEEEAEEDEEDEGSQKTPSCWWRMRKVRRT